jgi:hypothetical protein
LRSEGIITLVAKSIGRKIAQQPAAPIVQQLAGQLELFGHGQQLAAQIVENRKSNCSSLALPLRVNS